MCCATGYASVLCGAPPRPSLSLGTLHKKAYVLCGEEHVLGARGAPRGPRYRSSAAPLYLPSVGRGSRSPCLLGFCGSQSRTRFGSESRTTVVLDGEPEAYKCAWMSPPRPFGGQQARHCSSATAVIFKSRITAKTRQLAGLRGASTRSNHSWFTQARGRRLREPGAPAAQNAPSSLHNAYRPYIRWISLTRSRSLAPFSWSII